MPTSAKNSDSDRILEAPETDIAHGKDRKRETQKIDRKHRSDPRPFLSTLALATPMRDAEAMHPRARPTIPTRSQLP